MNSLWMVLALDFKNLTLTIEAFNEDRQLAIATGKECVVHDDSILIEAFDILKDRKVWTGVLCLWLMSHGLEELEVQRYIRLLERNLSLLLPVRWELV